MSIITILYGAKLVITLKNQLVHHFPKMPSIKVAKIVGEITTILGIGIFVIQIL